MNSTRFMWRRWFASLASIVALCGSAFAQTQTAVEYYYADWNYYFITSFPDEQAVLDGGAFGGVWRRTGQTFRVWSQPIVGSLPTCRFFSLSFAPKSSHFYTPYPAECATVQASPDWQYEAIAFHVLLPDSNTGRCPAGTSILFRLYNNGMGGAPNHRYTQSPTVFNQMRLAGWIFEGDGRTGAFVCVPLTAPPRAIPDGLWFGNTSANETVWGIVLSNGVVYLLYSLPGSSALAGVIQGNATFGNGALASTNARDFNITPYHGVFPGTIAGTFIPQNYMQGTAALGSISKTYSLLYSVDYDEPINLTAIAGTFIGSVASSLGVQAATLNVSAAGVFSGSAPGCTFSGTALPHGTVGVLDISVRFNGGQCIFGTSTLTGQAYYDAAGRQILGAAPNATRTDGFIFIGTKP